MKRMITVVLTVIFFGISTVSAQGVDAESLLKTYINNVVQDVKNAEQSQQKRELLNTSFDKIISVVNKAEVVKDLTEGEQATLSNFKQSITDKKNEINGVNGFVKVHDSQLDVFADYVQQDFEQADEELLGVAIIVTFAALLWVMIFGQ